MALRCHVWVVFCNRSCLLAASKVILRVGTHSLVRLLRFFLCAMDIVGQDIESRATKQEGRAVPSQPKRPKVEQLSDDEEEEEDGEAPLIAALPQEDRLENDPEAQVRKNAVHVYGLDFLKTHHMEEIFVQFGHKCVEWINASSANIIFKNADGAKKALESLSFPKTEDEPWRRTPDILVSEGVPPIFLQLRLATVKDVKPSKKSVPKAMSPMHYAQVFYKNQQEAMRQGYRPGRPKAKPKPKAGIKRLQVTEEEQQKRQKRADRFGDEEVTVVQTDGKDGKNGENEKDGQNGNDGKEDGKEGDGKEGDGKEGDGKEGDGENVSAPNSAPVPAPNVSRTPPKVVGVPAPKIRPEPDTTSAEPSAEAEPAEQAEK